MTEGIGITVDVMMLLAAIVGVGRSIEHARSADPAAHGLARAVLVLTLSAAAATSADGWRQWLYGSLMPLGAFYGARALSAPIASLLAVQRHTSRSDQSGRNTPPR